MAEPCAEAVLVRPGRCFFPGGVVLFISSATPTREVEKPMNIQTCISAGSGVSLELLRA